MKLGLMLALTISTVAGASEAALVPGSLESGGRTRTFLYVEPASPPGTALLPLIISLHGRLGQGKGQARLTGMDLLASKHSALVVFPDGINRSWADARGKSPASKKGVDDVAFLGDLIDLFVKDHRADPRRVYVAGMSNGGMMTLTLACQLAPRLAGIGVVAAELPQTLVSSCKLSRPVPLVLIMGTLDPLVPFKGGKIGSDVGGAVLSAEDTAKTWASWNGCTSPPTSRVLPDTDPNDSTRISEERWTAGCREGSEVQFLTVTGGGHTWPGGMQYLPALMIGHTSRDLDASELIWTTLSAHTR